MKTLIAAIALTVAASAPALAQDQASSSLQNSILPIASTYKVNAGNTFGFTGVSDVRSIDFHEPENELLPSGARQADSGNVFGFRVVNRTAGVVGLGAAYQSPAAITTDFGSGN